MRLGSGFGSASAIIRVVAAFFALNGDMKPGLNKSPILAPQLFMSLGTVLEPICHVGRNLGIGAINLLFNRPLNGILDNTVEIFDGIHCNHTIIITRCFNLSRGQVHISL